MEISYLSYVLNLKKKQLVEVLRVIVRGIN